MHHFHQGPGPKFCDTVDALDPWVEEGVPPGGIIATKYAGGDLLGCPAHKAQDLVLL